MVVSGTQPGKIIEVVAKDTRLEYSSRCRIYLSVCMLNARA